MRYCRRFLAGIPHFRVGTHVFLTRPPLAPLLREKRVRLACVRHAASVYPEPGSNSPSKMYIESRKTRLKFIVNELSPIDRLITVLHLFLTTLQLFRYSRCFRTSARLCSYLRAQVEYYHCVCVLSSTFLHFRESTIFLFQAVSFHLRGEAGTIRSTITGCEISTR